MSDINKYNSEFWINASDNLIKALPKLIAAIKTLENKGYTYHGGELWKPPIGKPINLNLVEQLQQRIKNLEIENIQLYTARSANELKGVRARSIHTEKLFNNIKAQGVEEAIDYAEKQTYMYISGDTRTAIQQQSGYIKKYADKLRGTQ